MPGGFENSRERFDDVVPYPREAFYRLPEPELFFDRMDTTWNVARNEWNATGL
jgi:hypothetical protein